MENNIGYLYVDAMCTVDTYFCGMPVLYEKKEDGQYHKKQCYCRHIQGGMPQCPNCKHFEIAPEIAGEKDYIRDKLLR